ncbi:NADP-dependent oxidoreductase domain-containing protein [Gautieria morchelliformis]|nr:NADP-dependent oxidoreductase domain-containing protein [Gautieria morchelliformis]
MPVRYSVKLNTGAEMPTVGLGTWKSEPGKVSKAVAAAIKAGYRHIDTAAAYANEKEVGDGMKAGMKAAGIDREDVFLTTKLPNDYHGNPLQALETSLEKLQTSYLDLWLMHWPAPIRKVAVSLLAVFHPSTGTLCDIIAEGPDKSIDWLDTWKKMEEIYKAHPDKVRAIGVSNFYVPYLERLLNAPTIVPAVNQIELHPLCQGQDVVDFCRKRGIVVTAYSPLGSDDSRIRDNPVVKEIAENHGVNPSNILISLQANREGVTVIPKSVTEQRIIDNFKTVNLTDEEVAKLNSLGSTTTFRVCTPKWTGWGDLGFPQ